MRVIVNEQQYILPSSLSEITLGTRIRFQKEVGDTLDMMAKSIDEMPDGYEKELEILQFAVEKMFRTFAFFVDADPEDLKNSEFVDEIARIYYSSLKIIFEEEAGIELKTEFFWNNESWFLSTPELKHGSSMKYGELIDAKQSVSNMIELGNNKWEYLLPLCAIYLRRKDEEYDKEFLFEGSDRLKQMESLPLDIALQVGFFLSSSLNIFKNTLQFSSQEE